MEKAKLDPVKMPSAAKVWTIWYEADHPYFPCKYNSLKEAQDEIEDLRALGIIGPIHIYELVEIHRERSTRH